MANPDTTDRRYFLARRIFSISGFLPVGGFLLIHIYTNTYSLFGREAFNEKVGDIQKLPYLLVIELLAIFAPLLVHALLGFVIVFQARYNTYGYTRNWMFTLQRVTGVLAFAFICFHLYEYWAQKQLGLMPWESFYDELGQNLAKPWKLAIYAVGITATVFHFANGIWNFAVAWGLTITRAAQRRLALVCGVFGVGFWFLSMNIVLNFSTGEPLVPVRIELPSMADDAAEPAAGTPAADGEAGEGEQGPAPSGAPAPSGT